MVLSTILTSLQMRITTQQVATTATCSFTTRHAILSSRTPSDQRSNLWPFQWSRSVQNSSSPMPLVASQSSPWTAPHNVHATTTCQTANACYAQTPFQNVWCASARAYVTSASTGTTCIRTVTTARVARCSAVCRALTAGIARLASRGFTLQVV